MTFKRTTSERTLSGDLKKFLVTVFVLALILKFFPLVAAIVSRVGVSGSHFWWVIAFIALYFFTFRKGEK